jgi:hypothetical protein
MTEPISTSPPPPKSASGSRTYVRLLCLGLLLYIPVQWIGGSPGGTRIFDRRHRELAQEFHDMRLAMRQQILSQCAEHGVHDIFFAGGTVTIPYLVNDFKATPDCRLHGETAVTQLATEPQLACSSEIVYESRPDAWAPVHYSLQLGPLEGRVVPVSAWESSQRDFGFKLLQAGSCTRGDITGVEKMR